MYASILGTLGATAMLVIGIVLVILAIMLVIAPLMIWKHAKRTADTVEALRRDIACCASNQVKSLEELRLLREVLKSATE